MNPNLKLHTMGIIAWLAAVMCCYTAIHLYAPLFETLMDDVTDDPEVAVASEGAKA